VEGDLGIRDPALFVFVNKLTPNPNLYHKLGNTGSTQTYTILSLSPNFDDVVNHVTAKYVTKSFPNLSRKLNDD